MRLFDAGQEAHGFIAVGQIATGVIAVGQLATGVVAIGQVARGVVAIGQGAIGIFTLGMGSAGLCFAVGMVGVGGLGAGLVLPLIPSLGMRYALPKTTTLDAIEARGWVAGGVVAASDGGLRFVDSAGHTLDVRVDAPLRRAARAHAEGPDSAALLHVRRDERGPIVDRLMRIPVARWRRPGMWVAWALQLTGLVTLATAWWLLVGRALISFILTGEPAVF